MNFIANVLVFLKLCNTINCEKLTFVNFFPCENEHVALLRSAKFLDKFFPPLFFLY